MKLDAVETRKRLKLQRMILRKNSSYSVSDTPQLDNQGSKIIHSDNLTLQDINSTYPIDRVALAFYYGASFKKIPLMKIAIITGIGLSLL